MILSTAAAQVMSLSIDGKVEDALALAERGLVDGTGASPSEQAGLWYAIANVELVRGSMPGVLTAAERCVALAVESDNAGWASCGLSVRALALARQGRMEPALLDLARAEAELAAATTPGCAAGRTPGSATATSSSGSTSSPSPTSSAPRSSTPARSRSPRRRSST